MVVAAIVEVVRLGMVRRMDLFTSTAAVPMSVFWLVPQYFIIGAAEIMVNIGTLEMFYSEVCFAATMACEMLGCELFAWAVIWCCGACSIWGNAGTLMMALIPARHSLSFLLCGLSDELAGELHL